MFFLPLLAQAQSYDTISGPNGRYHKYYYSAWFDSCGIWNDTQTRFRNFHPEVPGSLMVHYLATFITDWSVGIKIPQVPAKTEYVPQISALKGVAVVTYDSVGNPYNMFSNCHVSEVTSDTLAPDTCVVFTVDSNDMVILASGRWDTATPKIYKVPWHEDSLHAGFAYLKVFEVYFKTPIEVSDTFYITGTPYNMECNPVGNYLHPPHFYAQLCAENIPPDDPCLPTLEEVEYRRTHPEQYVVTWGGNKPILNKVLSGFMQWGGFFPIFAYDSVSLDLQTADSVMGLVSPQPGLVPQWLTHTITAIPNTGYKFTHWNDGNTENPRRVLMDKDSTFIAYFAPKAQYQVAVSTESPEVGYATGGGTYYEDDIATLEAFPASDQYRFSFWGDGNTSNPRYHVVNGDTSFVAFFREVTAIEEVDGTQGLFTLTPNPTTGKVTITVAQPAPQSVLTLRDAAGHEVMRTPMPAERPSMTLDLSSLPAGAYFVTLTTPTATSTQRLVVK